MIIKKTINKEELQLNIFKTLNSLYGWELTENELKVLDKLATKAKDLFRYNKNTKDVMGILFSKSSKESMIEGLNISYNTFHNILSSFRKKGFIKEDILDKKFLIVTDKNEFKLTIEYGTST